MHEILLNIESKETRYALLKNGDLRDLIVERKKERQLTGNIYRGRVRNILHNIQSAFIDINEGENGFIHISDIIENTKKFEQLFDMDFDLDYDIKTLNEKEQQNLDIEQLMKPDQPVLVQVVKEPIGSKGARLTSNVSIAGRYLVLLPNSSHRGVSRKIEDRVARERLKKLIRAFEMPQDMGLICRTASASATQEMLIAEAHDLLHNWQNIMENFKKASEPTLLYAESDLIKRAVITAIDKRYDRILVDDYATYQTCKRLYSRYSSEHPLRIEYYRDKVPMFERFNVEREIEKTLRRKIWLPSGGYLFFDRTEAMYTIDVNSGRSSNNKTDVEESLVRINLEAAEEIARQLRLRNIGGLIICDFIDMRLRKNQRRVLERLKDCMKEDSAKCTILGMSEFGLVEMTRQRNRGSLLQTIFTGCPYCAGSGVIKSHESLSIEIERAFKKIIACHEQFALKLVVHPELDRYLNVIDKQYLFKLATDFNAHLSCEVDDRLHLNEFHFYSTITNKRIEV
ncbi:ribonuclease G [Candidatus Protochlamydia naegleriophila]|uniref:Ribonuclease G n=1 Tax=Candidatus Protochlamydia naegleriophila TaxID=389348 RepID=A0A0U5J7V7_9BACT|nr:Rne/Rng family ribonuclease [Candidatus Protochlamydia naegleriophila]CUI16169.1 ribonuclease G [Candidatus Protochlamydia naegleriophila]